MSNPKDIENTDVYGRLHGYCKIYTFKCDLGGEGYWKHDEKVGYHRGTAYRRTNNFRTYEELLEFSPVKYKHYYIR